MSNISDENSTAGAASTVGAHHRRCKCGCLLTFPQVLYRNFRGEGSVFTCILQLDSGHNYWKLNDPNYRFRVNEDMMASPESGHKMDNREFILDVAQYHQDPKDRLKATHGAKDIDGILKDFSDKPLDFEPLHQEPFATLFPHGTPGVGGRWTVPQVRAGDAFKVTVQKYVDMVGMHAQEHCCVRVLAVTQIGIVKGYMVHDIQLPLLLVKSCPDDTSIDPEYALQEGDLVSFPVTCVFGVKHGENWKSGAS
jgi:hypothetical protein